jgi:hypothetical protein
MHYRIPGLKGKRATGAVPIPYNAVKPSPEKLSVNIISAPYPYSRSEMQQSSHVPALYQTIMDIVVFISRNAFDKGKSKG